MSNYNFDHIQGDRETRGHSSNKNNPKDMNGYGVSPSTKKRPSSGSHSVSSGSSTKQGIKKVVALIVAGILILFCIRYFTNPLNKLSNYISSKDYSAAVQYYNSKVYDKKKYVNEGNQLLSSCISSIEQDYYDGLLDYSSLDKTLKDFSEIKSDKIRQQVASTIEKAKSYEAQKNYFTKGKKKYKNKDYLSAMSLFSKVTESYPYYSEAQEYYAKCRDKLLSNVDSPKTKEDYQSFIDKVEEYLLVVSEDDVLINRRDELKKEYNTILTDEKRQKYLIEAEEKYNAGEIQDSFYILEKGIKELSSDKMLTERLEQYHNSFIDTVTETVNGFINNKEFDLALDYISDALSIYECNQFYNLEDSIYIAKENSFGSYEGEHVYSVKESGTIYSKDEINEYSFTADVEGIYCLYFTEMEYEFEVKVQILNYLHEEMASAWISNNESLTTESIPEGEYSIVITGGSKTGSYEFAIFHQKHAIDINQFARINDAIEYKKQQNNYLFTPDCSGIYRFDFSELMYDTEIRIVIYNHLNEPVLDKYINEEEGVTANDLEAGEHYRICISQSSGLTQYSLEIGRQKPVKKIEDGRQINGKISFIDQSDYYLFSPKSNRQYTISGNPSTWDNWYIEIFDKNNNPVKIDDSGESFINVTLSNSNNYTIKCYYKDSLTDYSFTIK